MSTTTFRNVALIGATGNLGSKILSALANAGFAVTAIQRAESSNPVPSSTKSIKVDLSSQDQLTSAFKGQDVVISAAPNPKFASEKLWINAAVAAGVKRIVPSEFSTNLESKMSQQLPIVKDKLETRKYIEELAAANKIKWTSINCGAFFVPMAWMSGWLGPNFQAKTATYHDGGNRIVCSSTLEQIGLAVAKVLAPEHATSTANEPIYIYSTPVSERRMTSIAAKLMGIKPTDFQEKYVDIATVTKEAYEALEKGDTSKMLDFYFPFCFGDGYGGDFRDMAWNERLGLSELSDAEVEDIVKSWL